MGLQGSPQKPMIIPMYLNRNGQAITLTKSLLDRGVRPREQLKPLALEAKAKGSPMTFAMTYPPGTHAMWTRYWLGAGGINPDRDVALITIPPAQMVANMKVGKMDGYCGGGPWGARAIVDGIGFTAITTQQLWKDHPEKVLGFTEEFATKNPKTVKAVMRAILEASQWNDKLENRPRMAEVVAQAQYINCPKEIILGRLLGDYDYGDGRKEKDKYYMTFFDRQTNFPMKSHGVWWLTQFRRWGMVKEAPDYKGLVDRVHRPDIFREVAREMGVETPRDDMNKETLFAGVTFDPPQPLAPIVEFLAAISPLAWLPLGLVIFQKSEPAAIFTIALCAMWPTVINTAVGVRSISQDYLNVGRVLKLSRFKMLTKIIIPASLPYVFTGYRLSLGLAWLVIVASEMLTGTPGVGGFLWQEYNSLGYSHILLSVITIGTIGFTLDRVMGFVEARVRTV